MATVERELHGADVIVRYRGRVMKVHQKDAQPSKEQRRICVLTIAASYALEHWNIAQPCFGECSHTHYTRDLVNSLVRDGALRWVGTGKNIAAWTAGRKWKGVPSGPARMRVMQLV